jgi:hypothetical protein
MIYIDTGNKVLPPNKWLGWHLENHKNVQAAKPSSTFVG